MLPLLGVYMWMVFQTAWVSDDAYITFRSMENFIHGYGPVYNIGERVQVFTHPLWFLGQSLANFFFNAWKDNPLGDGQSYFLNTFLSIALAFLTMIVLVYGLARSNRSAILGMVILILSKAYLDYSSSGLENPLTHLILILFIWLLLTTHEFNRGRICLLALLAALGSLDRLDTLLFYIPVMVLLFWQSARRSETLLMICIGFLPLLVWEIFSLIYYGVPFPNTAYAKINTGIPALSLIRQGFFYYLNSLRLDPITLSVIFVTTIYFFIQNERPARVLAAGILLYLIYTLSIGGDFMSGRYFSAPLLAATTLLVRIDFSVPTPEAASHTITTRGSYYLLLSIVVVIGIAPLYLIPERANSFGVGAEGGHRVYVDAHDISDERRVYAGMNLPRRFQVGPLVSEFARGKWVFDPEAPVNVKLVGPLGFRGYLLGPDVHVIDLNSLADPLMPRMPLYQPQEWRIGHFRHFIPPGYLETLRSGENQIVDKNIAQYYDRLSFVVRGNLWSWPRMVEAWKLNTGRYDYLLENIMVTP